MSVSDPRILQEEYERELADIVESVRSGAAFSDQVTAERLLIRLVGAWLRPSFTELLKDRLPNIGIRITQRDHGLLIEVWDSDPTPLQGADAHLTIVANVSQDWGCYQPRGGGKVIWAELAMPRQQHTRHTCGVCA